MDFLSDRDRLEQGEFSNVIAWQRAMDLSVAIYRLTDGWPRVDPLDLTMEIRRTAVDLPSVIARGFGMGERDALLDCLRIALDSAQQLHAQLGVSVRVGYCEQDAAQTFQNQLTETVEEIETLRSRYDRL